MSHELFASLLDRPARNRAGSRYGLPISVAAHVAALLVIVVIPLVATDVLPSPRAVIAFVEPAPPPLPPAAPPAAQRPAAAHPFDAGPGAVPVVAPSGIGQETVAPPLGDVPAETVPGGLSVVEGAADSSALAPPPPLEPAKPVEPRHVGGAIRAPARIRDIAPVYPALAQAAHVEGIVIIEAVISQTGDVENARVLRSVPLLDEAALAAVRQWKFTPTLLNGIPVPVVYTVTVRFALNR
jgi:protein TonB